MLAAEYMRVKDALVSADVSELTCLCVCVCVCVCACVMVLSASCCACALSFSVPSSPVGLGGSPVGGNQAKFL